MNEERIIQHWNYFCSLAEMLDDTKEYVYHGSKEMPGGSIELVNRNVYSDKFKQIIILASSEFENITRSICQIKGEKVDNILDITNCILKEFPRITETEVITLFWEGLPLEEWKVEGRKVKGLDWWNAYNALKHFREGSYEMATLQNAVLSLSGLYIVNLYLQKITLDHMRIADNYPVSYFRCKYMPNYVRDAEGELPDFGNKSSREVLMEMFPELGKNNE